MLLCPPSMGQALISNINFEGRKSDSKVFSYSTRLIKRTALAEIIVKCTYKNKILKERLLTYQLYLASGITTQCTKTKQGSMSKERESSCLSYFEF